MNTRPKTARLIGYHMSLSQGTMRTYENDQTSWVENRPHSTDCTTSTEWPTTAWRSTWRPSAASNEGGAATHFHQRGPGQAEDMNNREELFRQGSKM